MNKRIDLSKLGGYPLAQEDLDWLQTSYRGAFAALANTFGDMVIISGMVETAGNITAGWISIGGELLPFEAGTIGTGDFYIDEIITPLVYDDGNSKDALYERIAKFGGPGTYNYNDLVRLTELQNFWIAGDIKEKYCDAAYIAANFDGSGFGINREKGWQIMAFALPDSAGKTFINYDPGDADYDEPGKMGGDKTKTLASNEQGTFTVAVKTDDLINASGGGGNAAVRIRFNGNEPADGSANAAAFGANLTVALSVAANAHDVMNPYYVTLKLLKL